MLTRLKTKEEEAEVEVIQIKASIVKKELVKEFIKNKKIAGIPSHLKLIKEYDENSVIILTNDPNSDITVKVPASQPLTEAQYNKAKEIWPCKYFFEKETKICENFVKETFSLATLTNFSFCTNFCIIRNKDQVYALEYDSDNILGHSVFKAIEAVSQKKVGYLCTDMDAFIYSEPCLSCAMAFVHGRIKRVFVLKKGQGTFSDLKMNYNKNINHRYKVYFLE